MIGTLILEKFHAVLSILFICKVFTLRKYLTCTDIYIIIRPTKPLKFSGLTPIGFSCYFKDVSASTVALAEQLSYKLNVH